MFHFLTVIQLSLLSSPTCHPSHGRYCLWLVLATNEPIAATSCDYWPPSLSKPIKTRIAETGCFKDSSWTIKEPHPFWMHSVVGLCPGLCSLVSLLHFGPLWPSPATIFSAWLAWYILLVWSCCSCEFAFCKPVPPQQGETGRGVQIYCRGRHFYSRATGTVETNNTTIVTGHELSYHVPFRRELI